MTTVLSIALFFALCWAIGASALAWWALGDLRRAENLLMNISLVPDFDFPADDFEDEIDRQYGQFAMVRAAAEAYFK